MSYRPSTSRDGTEPPPASEVLRELPECFLRQFEAELSLEEIGTTKRDRAGSAIASQPHRLNYVGAARSAVARVQVVRDVERRRETGREGGAHHRARHVACGVRGGSGIWGAITSIH